MHRHYSLRNIYSQRDPENLSKLLAEVKVASKISLLLFLSFCLNVSDHIEVRFQRLKIITNRFYTIYKINTM